MNNVVDSSVLKNIGDASEKWIVNDSSVLRTILFY
jgi:hypothetical protein